MAYPLRGHGGRPAPQPSRSGSPQTSRRLSAAILALLPACAAAPSRTADSQLEHHHELHLPPVGPQVSVALDGKQIDVVLANVPHEGSSASLVQVWKQAFPDEDAAALHFDLVGSDGFHPASRPACVRLLTGAEVGTARIDVATHDVSFDPTVKLPGCYRVKAVVRVDVTR
jgi:hypothetical protein